MSNLFRVQDTKVESSIPNWVLYALLSTVSLLIATTVHGALFVFTAAGIITLFVLSYMSKPIAEIQPTKEEKIFEKNKINRNTWNNPSEPNAQRKRYLKSINENQRRAA